MPPVLSDMDLNGLINRLIGPMASVRQRRRYIEDEWLRNYAAWQGWPTVSHFISLPEGSIRYFVPVARRAIERINSRVVKLLMPTAKWFQVQPFDDSSHEKAQAVDAVMRYVLEKKIKYKRIISSACRSLQLYNFACIHTSPKVHGNEVWPSQRVVDPYSFYIFPETAADNSEVLMMFEDSVIPYEIYESYTDPFNPDNGIALPLNPAKLQAPEWPYHLVERMAYRGLTTPSDFAAGFSADGRMLEKDFDSRREDILQNLSGRASAFVQLTNVSFRVSGAWFKAWIVYNYLDRDKGGEALHDSFSGKTFTPVIVKLEQIENQPLYQWGIQRPIPGELYTNSMMDDIRVLQILANNQLSQAENNRAVVAEPPIGVDVSNVNRTQDYVYRPRAKWQTDGNPNEVIKNMDVKDTTTTGLRMWQVTLGLINSSAGAGTIAEGQPGRNMPRAGFAVNSLINLALSDIQDIADTEEQELLTPSLADMWHVLVEYTPQAQLSKIPGIARKAGSAYSTNDLYGDYSFSWIGSLQFQDANTRADRLMKFLEILGNPGILQVMQSQGKSVDFSALLQQIWADGLGERGLDNIIIPAAPVIPAMPQGGQGNVNPLSQNPQNTQPTPPQQNVIPFPQQGQR